MEKCMESELGKVAVAGSGFLADGYDLYVIGQVEKVLAAVYVCDNPEYALHHSIFDASDCISEGEFKAFMSLLSSAALWGAVSGQFVFGTLADRLGRRRIFIATGALIILGSFFSACVAELGQGPRMLFSQLVICRALLGFGIGGEYPLSATIVAEGTSKRRCATLMSLVFANQGLGYLLSSTTMVLLAYSELSLDFTWRFALGFGAVVPVVSLYFRMMMHESEDFEKVHAAREEGTASVDVGETVKRYRWHLLGTAGNWFIFDVVFYANSLFNSDVTSIIQVGPGGLKSTMLRTLIIVLIMLPGYFFGACFINKLGRKNMQIFGYWMICMCFSVIALFYNELKTYNPPLFIVIYGMTFFFANFGPNLTTYVIPGELYPSQAKATLHGMSAASGKVGAAVGSMIMPYITQTPPTDDGLRNAMFMCSFLAIAGMVLTMFLTPRYKPAQLEPTQEDETVAFVPLRFQRRRAETRAMSTWEALRAKEDSSEDEEGDDSE